MRSEIKITDDGSSTLYVPEINEHYHSTYGAVQESMHVFIKMGLREIKKDKIRIFELGFGTGLNALLSFLMLKDLKSIEYYGLELFPLDWQVIEKLNFDKYLDLTKNQKNIFKKMHDSSWEKKVQLSPDFMVKKIKADITDYDFQSSFDLFYFDAFAPKIQPELWKEKIFRKLYHAMNNNGILVTYCAKGEVRRNLQNAGFITERLPGPPGKREILRAVKRND